MNDKMDDTELSFLKKLLKKLNLFSYFTPKQIRCYFFCVGICTVLWIAILVSSRLLGMRKIKAVTSLQRVFTDEQTDDFLKRPGLSDFLFLDGLVDEDPPQIFRGLVMEDDLEGIIWSDFASQYWIDPSTLGIRELSNNNEKILEEYFEKAVEIDPNF